MVQLVVNLNSVHSLASIEQIFGQVLVDNADDFATKEGARAQIFVQVQQVQNIQQAIPVDVQDFETFLQLLGLAIEAEGQKALNELHDCDLGPVVAIRHPQVQYFTEVGLVHADHVLYIPHEVLLSESCHTLDSRTFYLVLLFKTVQGLESLQDSTVLGFRRRLLEACELFVIVRSRHHNLSLLVLIFFPDCLLHRS